MGQNLQLAKAAQAEAQVAAVPASHDSSPTWGHAGKDGAYPRGVSENQVLADQLANEATVEAIVRKRTLEGESAAIAPRCCIPFSRAAVRHLCASLGPARENERAASRGDPKLRYTEAKLTPVFKTRCPFFNASANDEGWWEIADAGRAGAPATQI